MRPAIILLICCVSATPASAQTYVTGLLGADLIRSTRIDAGPFEIPNGDGETLSTALRVGTALGERWGVELEVALGGEIERETTFRPPINLLAGTTGSLFNLPFTLVPEAVIFPPITLEYSYELEQEHVTISPAAWVRQSLSGSIDLVYLGGLTFSRTESEQSVSMRRLAVSVPGITVPLIAPNPQATKSTAYGIGPMAGIDARWSLADHVMLVTGVRMQGMKTGSGDAWLIRASAGLGWMF